MCLYAVSSQTTLSPFDLTCKSSFVAEQISDNMSKAKNKIGYVAPPEPKFIREMKAKLGYQYQDTDSKLSGDAGDFDDREGLRNKTDTN